MTVGLLLFVAVASGCLLHAGIAKPRIRKIQTPKADELSASLGKQMASKTVSSSTLPVPSQFVILPRRTNYVYKVNLAWKYDPETLPLVSSFNFYMGRSPGVYDYLTNDIGTNLSYTFSRTNWDEERMNRHFFVVKAKDADGNETEPSNEVHYPPYPPDHFELSWSSNWDAVTILTSTNLMIPREQWDALAVVIGTNYFSSTITFDSCPHFFVLNKPDVLTIGVFNPNP